MNKSPITQRKASGLHIHHTEAYKAAPQCYQPHDHAAQDYYLLGYTTSKQHYSKAEPQS